MKIIKNHLLSILIIFLVGVFGARAFFHEGLYSAHDIWHQVARLYHYDKALADGQFMPTWVANMANGHGYPLFIFSYHVPWIFIKPFIYFGFSVENTLKTLFILGYVLSGLSFYVLANKIFKDKTIATISAITYLIAPYHFLSLFVSAAIGTVYQFLFLPLIFLGLIYCFEQENKKGIMILSISVALSILTHLMTFVYIAIFAGLFGLFLIYQHEVYKSKNWFKLWPSIVGLLLGIALSAFYLIPLFAYLQNIKASTEDHGFATIYKGNFVSFKQLIYSPWGYGPIISNAKDGEISLQVGIIQWLGFLGALFALPAVYVFISKFGLSKNDIKIRIDQIKEYLPHYIFYTTAFLLSLFLMLDYSKYFWDYANKITTLDYPFRLLLLSVFFGSLLLGFSIHFVNQIHKNLKYLAILPIMFITFYTNKHHMKVNMYTDFPLDLYIAAEKTTNTFNEYLPAKAGGELLNVHQPMIATASTTLNISDEKTNTLGISFVVQSSQSAEISLRQFDFVGQTVKINGETIEHQSDDLGRIKIKIASGSSTVVTEYKKTTLMQMSLATTFIALAILVLILTLKDKLKDQK